MVIAVPAFVAVVIVAVVEVVVDFNHVLLDNIILASIVTSHPLWQSIFFHTLDKSLKTRVCPIVCSAE